MGNAIQVFLKGSVVSLFSKFDFSFTLIVNANNFHLLAAKLHNSQLIIYDLMYFFSVSARMNSNPRFPARRSSST